MVGIFTVLKNQRKKRPNWAASYTALGRQINEFFVFLSRKYFINQLHQTNNFTLFIQINMLCSW